jgi:DNA polymerase-1
MKVIALDTETYLIQPGLLAPPLVCVSFCTVAEDGTPNPPGLLDRAAGLDFIEALLRRIEAGEDIHIVIHNAAFDMAVFCVERPHLLPLVFKAYDEGRIHCTKVRDQMLLNARGEMQDEDDGPKTEFHLASAVLRRFGVDISESKNDPNAWRLRYGELDGVPLSEWPAEAVTYAKDDAGWHLKVYLDQEREDHGEAVCERGYWPLKDEPGQTRAAFFLHLMSMHGVLTDATAVGALEAHLTEVVEVASAKLKASGIFKGKSTKKRDTGLIEVTWSKDTKVIKEKVEAGFAARNLHVPRTDPSDSHPDGQVKMDEDTLRMSGDPDLLVLADSMGDMKLRDGYVQNMQGRFKKKGSKTEYEMKGLALPGRGWLLNPSFNAVVSTGRTSSYKPNIQNPDKRQGVWLEDGRYVPGVRECIVPRDGFVFSAVDYNFIEMVAWADTCLTLPEVGFSRLAEAIREGKDPHCMLGQRILAAEGHRHTYEEVYAGRKTWAKDARTMSKPGNFGLMGGMGAESFAEFAWKSYGVRLTVPQAADLKKNWKILWEEADPFFGYVTSLQREAFGQPFTVVVPQTGFVRGGCTFSMGCNAFFQPVAARGAKEAGWNIARECYEVESSPLFGCRPVVFLHDEFILEVPNHPERAHLATARLERLMIEGMEKFIRNVPVGVEPTLMRRWFKEAGPVYRDGMLVPWEPVKAPMLAAS